MEISKADVRAEVERILATPDFRELGPDLNALVDGTLDSGSARKLRSRLAAYYEGPGKGSLLVIQVSQQGTVLYQAKKPGYQPTPERRLLMLGLCVIALVVVWLYYFLTPKSSP